MSQPLNFSVINHCESKLTTVTVTHTCNDTSHVIQLPTLEAGATASSSEPVTSYKHYKDYYKILFLKGGNAFGGDCYCLSNSDDDTVTIELYEKNYNVQYSSKGQKTPSCLNKSYNDSMHE